MIRKNYESEPVWTEEEFVDFWTTGKAEARINLGVNKIKKELGFFNRIKNIFK